LGNAAKKKRHAVWANSHVVLCGAELTFKFSRCGRVLGLKWTRRGQVTPPKTKLVD
jgi:hypothetical protein